RLANNERYYFLDVHLDIEPCASFSRRNADIAETTFDTAQALTLYVVHPLNPIIRKWLCFLFE
ncbi:MAG TPA: hypothetical protein PLX90_10015, partial [Anaerolineales bacterium]|nr:hypothetical protein [Anaerolineales bacterium]